MAQVGDKGMIVPGADGLPVFIPFGSQAGCSDGSPSMYVQVTGAGSKTVGWCDHLWFLPGDSGKEYQVCPTTYLQQRSTVVGGTDTWYNAKQVWYLQGPRSNANTVGNTRQVALQMSMAYNIRKYISASVTKFAMNYVSGQAKNNGVVRVGAYTISAGTSRAFNNAYDRCDFYRTGPALVRNPPTTPVLPTAFYAYPTSLDTQNTALGIITAISPFGSWSSNYIQADWSTNSYTKDGVTYSWRLGAGWPSGQPVP